MCSFVWLDANSHIDCAPLNQRGGVSQERYLSHRILHLLRAQICFLGVSRWYHEWTTPWRFTWVDTSWKHQRQSVLVEDRHEQNSWPGTSFIIWWSSHLIGKYRRLHLELVQVPHNIQAIQSYKAVWYSCCATVYSTRCRQKIAGWVSNRFYGGDGTSGTCAG
jgi:hypothetical protein